MGNETVQIAIIYVIIVEEAEKASIQKKSKYRIKDKIKNALLSIHYHIFPLFF